MKKYWLGLSMIKGLGPIRLNNLIKRFKNPYEIWNASKQELSQVKGIGKIAGKIVKQRKKININKIKKQLNKNNIKYKTIEDDNFPSILKNIYDPPPILYYKGNFDFTQTGIAIVGSRRCTNYGKNIAKKIAYKLVQRGITIISGMARGIDTCSHLGAVEGGGKTIAVLGSGLDVIYPPENKKLFREIQKNGLVLSEFPPGVEPLAQNFPRRNRIISGLAKGVLVVEASDNSGSLITSDLALEQGKEVFAVPGNINRAQSQGTNDLIKKGAKMVTNVSDILEEIFLYNDFSSTREKATYPQLTEKEEIVVKVLQTKEKIHINEVIELTDLKVNEINTILLKLELKGLISREDGKKYSFQGLQNLLKPI